MNEFHLRLFITGRSHRGETAARNVRQLFGETLRQPYQLTVVDVLETPELAEASRVMATPTLIKESPGPIRRVIGDLSDHAAVLRAIGVEPRQEAEGGNAGE
ncbi:MAG: circadian clock KaiB family protein [Pseudomonadota bacterium]